MKNKVFHIICTLIFCLILTFIMSTFSQTNTDTGTNASKNTTLTNTNTKTSKNSVKKNKYYGRLKVNGPNLVDKNGKKVQLKGISTHGLQWFPRYVNEKTFKELHNTFNMNLIRLALYTDENGYCTGGNKKNLEKLIDNGVKYASKNNMYVIIDWHILHDLSPKKYQKQAKSFFNKMAKKYKNNDHVIYEICNEPNGNTKWKDIYSYATTIIPIIHKYNKNAVIIVGTPTWSQDILDVTSKPLPKTSTYKNILYALHFYAGTHKDDLRNRLKQAYNKKIPIFVSEFGICDASGNGKIDTTQANKWIAMLNKYSISYANWSLCNKNESASFLKSSCKKLYGFKTSDLSKSGLWLTNVLTGNKKVTTAIKNEEKKITNTPSNKPNSNNSSSKNNTSSQTNSNSKKIANIINKTTATKGLTVKLTATNSWKNGKKNCLQYNLLVKNTSKKKLNTWSVSVYYKKNVKIVQIWCSKAKTSGKKVTITPENYNKTIQVGKSISDIGLIVSY